MRSITAVPMRNGPAPAGQGSGGQGGAARVKPAGPRAPLDRLRVRDRIESIARLRAAVRALGDVDVSGWDDATLTDHLDELSRALCGIDAELTRVAEAVRARGFRIAEPRAA
ncbi:hypothetical protein [Actinoplanes awajinensis]|uniref:hypothetical protein n=1 Tax=Actinoplanes awajinensis TaxID=135946 RepID=UPI000A817989|nr:hypothetical protein [Actinoplanes awajinensis]